MAVKEELIITVNPDGTLKIKTEGFKGSDCEAELKPLADALGRTTATEKASEYYQQSAKQKGNVKTTK